MKGRLKRIGKKTTKLACYFPLILAVGGTSPAFSQQVDSSTQQNGITKLQSPYDFTQTQTKFEQVLTDKNLTLFAKVDHSANAKKADLTLAPTVTYIFGNPKVGTPLMQCQQSFGLDLPQKMLIYQDEQGKVFMAYNNPSYLATRHNLIDCQQAVEKVTKALAGISAATVAK